MLSKESKIENVIKRKKGDAKSKIENVILYSVSCSILSGVLMVKRIIYLYLRIFAFIKWLGKVTMKTSIRYPSSYEHLEI